MTMRTTGFLTVVGVVGILAAPAFGQRAAAPAAQVPVADRVFNSDVYPQARVSLPGGVVSLSDLTYTTVSGFRRLKLDLYLPPGPTAGERPAIVYMHGGGWSGGTPRTTGAFENWPEVLASFAARGYVVASITYRLSNEAPFPAALQDAKAAVRWLRTNANTYGIDVNRFVSWGVSAGGQLAGLLATSCNVAELEPAVAAGRGGRGGGRGGARGAAAPAASASAPPAAPPSACVQGAVLWYGASNLVMSFATPRENADAAGPATENAYLGCTPPNCLTQAKAATVNTYVDPSDPPMLQIHGDVDTTVPVEQAKTLDALLKSNGVRSELTTFPEIGHSFIGKTGDATRTASRTALEKTIVFIDSVVGKK